MWPDQVSNPGPLTYESGALPTALRGPAMPIVIISVDDKQFYKEPLINHILCSLNYFSRLF